MSRSEIALLPESSMNGSDSEVRCSTSLLGKTEVGSGRILKDVQERGACRSLPGEAVPKFSSTRSQEARVPPSPGPPWRLLRPPIAAAAAATITTAASAIADAASAAVISAADATCQHHPRPSTAGHGMHFHISILNRQGDPPNPVSLAESKLSKTDNTAKVYVPFVADEKGPAACAD